MGRNTVCYCSVFFGTNLLRQPSKRVNAPCKLRQWQQAGFWEPCRVFVFVCVFFLPLFPPTRQFKSSFSPLLCVIWLYSNPGTINPPVSFHYSCMGAPSRSPQPLLSFLHPSPTSSCRPFIVSLGLMRRRKLITSHRRRRSSV